MAGTTYFSAQPNTLPGGQFPREPGAGGAHITLLLTCLLDPTARSPTCRSSPTLWAPTMLANWFATPPVYSISWPGDSGTKGASSAVAFQILRLFMSCLMAVCTLIHSSCGEPRLADESRALRGLIPKDELLALPR